MNTKPKSNREFSVPDYLFDEDMSSTWSEMTPIESVVDNDSAGQNVYIFESPLEIVELKDIESYGGIHNYVDSVKCNAEALGSLKEHLDYKISEVSSSQRKTFIFYDQ